MIYRLEGKLSYIDARFLVVSVGGIGYQVFVTSDLLATLFTKEGVDVSLWTYQSVRENSLELFGFVEREELEFFELLLNVSGIGPRSALGIIGIASIDTLKRAIQSSDTSYLTKVSGIGKKTAEKIVIELRDKFGSEKRETGDLRSETEALEGLKSLGYSQNEARDALKQVDQSIVGAGARITQALKILSGK
jgi:holliday junction DNA helicase RuvA